MRKENTKKIIAIFTVLLMIFSCKKSNEFDCKKKEEFECEKQLSFMWDFEDNLIRYSNQNVFFDAWNLTTNSRKYDLGIYEIKSDTIKIETNLEIDTICETIIIGIKDADISFSKINSNEYLLFIEDFLAYKEDSEIFEITINYN